MSTANEREAALRRALQRAADYIEPTPGGLERIQERLRRPRPMLVAQLEAAGTVVLMRAPDVIEAVRRRTAKLLRLVWDRFGPKTAGQGPLRWLRPLAAMCVAVFVLGAGIYVGLAGPSGAFTIGVSVGAGVLPGSHPGVRSGSGGATLNGTASHSSYSGAVSTSPSSSACPTPTPQFQGPGGTSTTPSTQSSSPAASTSPITTPPPSSSPPGSPTPTPGSSSAGTGAAPAAGTSVNPVSAGANTGTGVNGASSRNNLARRGAATASASGAPTGKSIQPGSTKKYSRCSTRKPKTTPGNKSNSPSTATQTSAKVGQNQPGKAVAAKLD